MRFEPKRASVVLFFVAALMATPRGNVETAQSDHPPDPPESKPSGDGAPQETPTDREEIYVFRSFQETTFEGESEFCRQNATLAGGQHFVATTENYYSLWSVASEEDTGKMIDAQRRKIGDFRACSSDGGPGGSRLWGAGTLNGIPWRTSATLGAFQDRQQQSPAINSRVNRLYITAPGYSGGLISSNTVRVTGCTTFRCPGYLLSSVAVVRLWR